MIKKVHKTKGFWKKILTPEQFRITRLGGTEVQFSGKYVNFNEAGTYICVCCGNELFRSEDKYDSGSGWPSFKKSITPDSIEVVKKKDDIFQRLEVRCARCDAHLGYLFGDGPPPMHRRYSINSGALNFIHAPVLDEEQY